MSSAKMPVKNSQTTQPNLAITLSASQLRAFALSLYDTFGLNVVPIGANKKPVATWKHLAGPQLDRIYFQTLDYSQAHALGVVLYPGCNLGCADFDIEVDATNISAFGASRRVAIETAMIYTAKLLSSVGADIASYPIIITGKGVHLWFKHDGSLTDTKISLHAGQLELWTGASNHYLITAGEYHHKTLGRIPGIEYTAPHGYPHPDNLVELSDIEKIRAVVGGEIQPAAVKPVKTAPEREISVIRHDSTAKFSTYPELVDAVSTKLVERDGTTKHGVELSYRCFHHDDEHPSASYNISTGQFYCFACGAKGNAYGLAAVLDISIGNQWFTSLPSVELSRVICEISSATNAWFYHLICSVDRQPRTPNQIVGAIHNLLSSADIEKLPSAATIKRILKTLTDGITFNGKLVQLIEPIDTVLTENAKKPTIRYRVIEPFAISQRLWSDNQHWLAMTAMDKNAFKAAVMFAGAHNEALPNKTAAARIGATSASTGWRYGKEAAKAGLIDRWVVPEKPAGQLTKDNLDTLPNYDESLHLVKLTDSDVIERFRQTTRYTGQQGNNQLYLYCNQSTVRLVLSCGAESVPIVRHRHVRVTSYLKTLVHSSPQPEVQPDVPLLQAGNSQGAPLPQKQPKLPILTP